MTITLIRQRSIGGPNVWSRASVVAFQIELGSLAVVEPKQTRVLAGRLTEFLVEELVDPIFKLDPLEPIPFDNGRGPAALIGMLVLNLQRSASFPVTFCTEKIVGEQIHEVIVEQEDDRVGASAIRLAIHVVDRMTESDVSTSGAFSRQVSRFATRATARRLNVDSRPIVDAARRRGIPVTRLDPSGRIIELGNGAFRKRILGSVTSHTSVIGESVVENKYLTNFYLRSAGLPVPDSKMARTVEQAIAAARGIGFPVVVKPVDAGNSQAVTVDVRDDEGIAEAFGPAVSASNSGRVLVERYVAGNEYRVLVVHNRIVSASLRIPEQVVGDGSHTVRQLIDVVNADPRQGPWENAPFRQITVDARTIAMLARQDLHLDAIPRAGLSVVLKPTAKHREESPPT